EYAAYNDTVSELEVRLRAEAEAERAERQTGKATEAQLRRAEREHERLFNRTLEKALQAQDGRVDPRRREMVNKEMEQVKAEREAKLNPMQAAAAKMKKINEEVQMAGEIALARADKRFREQRQIDLAEQVASEERAANASNGVDLHVGANVSAAWETLLAGISDGSKLHYLSKMSNVSMDLIESRANAKVSAASWGGLTQGRRSKPQKAKTVWAIPKDVQVPEGNGSAAMQRWMKRVTPEELRAVHRAQRRNGTSGAEDLVGGNVAFQQSHLSSAITNLYAVAFGQDPEFSDNGTLIEPGWAPTPEEEARAAAAVEAINTTFHEASHYSTKVLGVLSALNAPRPPRQPSPPPPPPAPRWQEVTSETWARKEPRLVDIFRGNLDFAQIAQTVAPTPMTVTPTMAPTPILIIDINDTNSADGWIQQLRHDATNRSVFAKEKMQEFDSLVKEFKQVKNEQVTEYFSEKQGRQGNENDTPNKKYQRMKKIISTSSIHRRRH
ncbi:hypothetical protein CYMTET_51521, partial [Cymbomonas tetramitiformis]